MKDAIGNLRAVDRGDFFMESPAAAFRGDLRQGETHVLVVEVGRRLHGAVEKR
jgi:hypothetical protein